MWNNFFLSEINENLYDWLYINHQWKYWEIDICIIASTIMFLMNIFEDIQITEISVNIYSQ